MSLSIALSNALSGLNVNQKALAVLSQNIANANTAGYSRQIINQQSVAIDGNGAGVSIEDVTRKVDEYLVKSIRLQNGAVGRNNVVSDYSSRIQLLLGKPGSENSLDAYIGSFFNSLQALAQTPEDVALQQRVVNSAVTMATQTRQLSQGLQELRYQADQEIKQATDAINNDLVNIKALNVTISNSISLGKGVADLQDQRDNLLKDLSQYLDIQTYNRSDGQVTISTAGGLNLLDDYVYQLSYSPAGSSDTFAGGTQLSPILITRLDDKGNPTSLVNTLVTQGTSDTVATSLTVGKLKGFLDIRDKQIPAIVDQLDMLTSSLRDSMNAVHNAGISFPGDNSYTGERALNAQDYSNWEGQVRLAVLDASGKPVPMPYYDSTGNVPPLTLDLSSLDTGTGKGNPSVQGIIDEINAYYGVPQNKLQLGNLDNVRLVSDTKTLPNIPPLFDFDFELTNLSASRANFYVTGVQVADSSGANVTSSATGIPSVDLASSNTFTTTAGSNIVTVKTASTNTLQEGQIVYLGNPGITVGGIPGSALSGFFKITNVTPTGFQIAALTNASSDATGSASGQKAMPPYSGVDAGNMSRTQPDGPLQVNLTNNTSSPYYTFTLNIAVDDGEGHITPTQVTYRVDNNNDNLLNRRFAAQSATGEAVLAVPNSNKAIATAMLVDEEGVELPKTNGKYTTAKYGYLKIQAENSSYVLALDSLNSSEQGKPKAVPPVPGTNTAFSNYFGLNNFFKSNQYTITGDTVKGSAQRLEISDRLQKRPSQLSLGTLIQSTTPNGSAPVYTYERSTGDNSVIQRLADLGLAIVNFSATAGLGASKQTFGNYASSMIGLVSANAATAKSDQSNAQTLMDGYAQRSSAMSGVNLDTELANTVIYQNAYSASARVITVTKDLFDVLLQSFR